jgi:DNA-binding transcriptional LysR family regulator
MDNALGTGELEPVLERFRPKMDPISLVYPQTRHLSPKVRAFIDFMAAQFRSSSPNDKGGTSSKVPRSSSA